MERRVHAGARCAFAAGTAIGWHSGWVGRRRRAGLARMHQPTGCGTCAATGAAAEFRRRQRVQFRRRSDRARRRDIGGPRAMARRRRLRLHDHRQCAVAARCLERCGPARSNGPCRSHPARCSRWRGATTSRSGPHATRSRARGAATDVAEAWQCRVDDTARVATKAGDFDTFRVACSMNTVPPGTTLTRTFFYAPAIDYYVRGEDEPPREKPWRSRSPDTRPRSHRCRRRRHGRAGPRGRRRWRLSRVAKRCRGATRRPA